MEKKHVQMYHRGEQSGPIASSGPFMTYVDCHTLVVKALVDRRVVLDAALGHLASYANALVQAAVLLVETLRSGHKVLVVGNGGSAAEAQHFAAELVGRFKLERSPYAVISLTTDTAIITAIANDYGYQDIFARQVLALGQRGDLLLAFSTSGESENVLRAAQAGQQRLMRVIAVTGEKANRLAMLADVAVQVASVDTAIAQEVHMVVTHILCDITEARLSACSEPHLKMIESEYFSVVAEEGGQ